MSEYEARARQGREECLKKIRETDRKISAIYREAAKEMGAKAAGAKEGSLTKRWALDMQKSLTESSRRLGRDVLSEITSAVQEAAAIPGRVDGDWLRDAYAGAGGNLTGQTFRDMFTRTSDEALRMLLSGRAYLDGKSLSSRVWTQAGRLENGINQVIQQGIAQKKSAAQIARELEQYVNQDAHETIAQRRERVKSGARLPFAGNIEYSCQRLARTSVNHAYFLAMKESAKLNPFCQAVHWELSGAHFARQVAPFGVDICDEYATHDEGLGVGNWPVDGVPLPHAQCLCSQWPEVPETLDECAGRLKSWLNGGEDAALDESFSAWKEALQSGMPDRRLGSIRDDAGEVRKGLLEKIAWREDVQALSISEREKLLDRLNNASEAELETLSVIDKMSREAIMEVSELVTDKSHRDEISITTADGIVVTRYSKHLADRMTQRSVNDVEIYDGLTNPLQIKEDTRAGEGRVSRRYIGEHATVNINPETGTIITTWPTGTKLVRRIKK